MKLERVRSAIKNYEKMNQLGTDQILSLMLDLINDIRDEAEVKHISELNLISEEGREEQFLIALNSIALETVDVMKHVNPDEMEEFQRYARRVCDKEAGVQKVSDTIAQWQKMEEECREVNLQIAQEEKKLQEKKEQLQRLEEKKKELEKKVADSCMTEEACESEIKRLTEELDKVPGSERFKELRKTMTGVKKHYQIISQIVSDFLDDHSEEARLEMKFELSEKACKDHLQVIEDRICEIETYYGKMLKHVEELRIEKENSYGK